MQEDAAIKRDVSKNPLLRWWRNRPKPISPDLIPKDRPYFCGPWPFIVIVAAALLGTFAAAYLTQRHVLLVTEIAAAGDSPLCRADGRISCDAVLLTEYATIYGSISAATLGLMGFVFVLWLTANAILNERLRKTAWITLLLYFVTTIGFSWYFLDLMFREINYVCPWCLVVHAVNAFCLVVIIVGSLMRKQEFLWPEIASLGERVYFLCGGLLLSLLVFFAAGFAENSLALTKSQEEYARLAGNPNVVAALVKSAPTVTVPIAADDPVYGDPNSPYTIVIFSDFACPRCATAESWLQPFVGANPGVVKLVFKHYPLSSYCNKAVGTDLHPKSCQAATAAQAAFILGGNARFWDYGRLLFRHQDDFARSPWVPLARHLKVDPIKFQELLSNGSAAEEKVRRDIELGIELRLNATPQIFFEGKKLPADAKGPHLVRAMEELVRSTHPDKRNFNFRRPFL